MPDLTKTDILSTVVYVAFNREKSNPTLLKDYPHRDFLDLVFFYRYVLDPESPSSPVLSYADMQKYGICKEELDQRAKENSEETYEQNTLNACLNLPPDFNEFMIVLTNESKQYGASVISSISQLTLASTLLNSDLYLIPSSIHEIIAVPAIVEEMKMKELKNMVQLMNIIGIEPNDYLSDQVYFYDRNLQKVSMI